MAGDFNQWKIHEALVDCPDLIEHSAGATQGDRSIDRSFSNLPDVLVTGTLPPLETDRTGGEDPKRSDHKVVFFQFYIPKAQTFYLVFLSALMLRT